MTRAQFYKRLDSSTPVVTVSLCSVPLEHPWIEILLHVETGSECQPRRDVGDVTERQVPLRNTPA